MAVFDIYSKRQKRLRGEFPDVLTCEKVPIELRAQISQILKSTIISYQEGYRLIKDTLCREYGKFCLGTHTGEDPESQVHNFLLRTPNTEEVIDVVELAFMYIDKVDRRAHRGPQQKTHPDEAISELNVRFKEHGIGFSYESGEIIKVDSTFIHNEITKPAIALLWNQKFEGANEEYLKAHQHYRDGRNQECLSECLKAFESTMKIICNEKGWGIKSTYTAKKLIQVCFQNELVPTFSQNQFTSLQSLLESGIPTLRNKLGGHGQGNQLKDVSDEITRYGLNLTAVNIIFLIEQSGMK